MAAKKIRKGSKPSKKSESASNSKYKSPNPDSRIIEVVKDNFFEILPSIFSAIDAASFVTIDTELSGLCASKAQRYSILDDAQERYLKLRDSALNFGLLQFGLSAFIWNEEKQKYWLLLF